MHTHKDKELLFCNKGRGTICTHFSINCKLSKLSCGIRPGEIMCPSLYLKKRFANKE